MITTDNFAYYVQTIKPEEVQAAIDAPGDYIELWAHIFNAGAFASIESKHYDEDEAQEAADNGQLYCDKDDFLRLIEETNAMEV